MMSQNRLLIWSVAAAAFLLSAEIIWAKDIVKIAFVGPLTGGNSPTGLGGRNSAMLAVQLRNADPQAKYAYELVPFDDECKPNIGIQVATKAASDKSIVGGVTHYCSAVAIVTVDIYHRFGLPVVIWGAILPEITYGNDYKEIHRVNGTMVNEAKLAADFLTEQGYKKFVSLHDTTDYGKGHNKYFSQFLKEDGGVAVGTFPVSSDQQDFTTELTQVKELKPQIVYFAGTTPPGVRIRTQMAKLGVDAQFMGVSGVMTSGYIEGTASLAEGTLSFHNGAPIEKYPQGKAFLKAYQQAGFREDPDAYGPFAFTAANLIMDAVEKVGPDRKAIMTVMNSTKGYQALTGEVNFDDHRQNIVRPYAYVVQDGKWVYWPDSEYATGKRSLTGISAAR